MGTTRTISGMVTIDIVEVERAVVRERDFAFTMVVDDGLWMVYEDDDYNYYGFLITDEEEMEECL